MITSTDFEITDDIRNSLISQKVNISKPSLSERKDLYEKIKKKIGSLKFQRDRLVKELEENQVQIRFERLQKVEEDLYLMINLLKSFREHDRYIETFYNTFQHGMNAYLKGAELLETLKFCQEHNSDMHDELTILLNMNIALLEKDTEKVEKFFDDFRNKSQKLNQLITKKINECLEN